MTCRDQRGTTMSPTETPEPVSTDVTYIGRRTLASNGNIPTPELERAIADLADRGWTRLPQRAGGDGGR